MKITLEECRRICQEKPEFTERKKDGYIVFDYNMNDSHSFDDPVASEMRGIAFDYDGNIVSRPLHKFFNLGEKPVELDLDNAVVTEKLDGSMIRAIKVGNGWVLGTRAGQTDVSKLADDFITNKINYHALIDSCVKFGNSTPIFEFWSKENRVVLEYPESRMTLLAIRENDTGKYVDYDSLCQIGATFGVPVVKKMPLHNFANFSELTKTIKDATGIEGVVVSTPTGWVKIKADEYCLMHKAVDGVKFDKDVCLLVIDGTIDDVLPLLSSTRQEEVIKLRDEIISAMHMMALAATTKFVMLSEHHSDRKAFALEAKTFPFKNELFALLDGKPVEPVIEQRFRKAAGGIATWKAFYEEFVK